jgi:hypothetical protein
VVHHGLQRLAGDRVDLECQQFSLSPEPRGPQARSKA